LKTIFPPSSTIFFRLRDGAVVESQLTCGGDLNGTRQAAQGRRAFECHAPGVDRDRPNLRITEVCQVDRVRTDLSQREAAAAKRPITNIETPGATIEASAASTTL
jgi:hypothetical protein